MLVCWDFIDTLEIITRTLREVVNRVRLCGHHTVRGSRVEVQSHLFACLLEFHRTLKIITRTLREVVNRERWRGTIAFYFSCFRKVVGCQAP